MASVPREVEKQGQLADELHAKLYGNTEQSAPVESATEVAKPQEATPPAEQSAPTTENAQPAEKKKFPDADPNSDAWEQKYKVLANKYSAEVPRYAQELRALKEENSGLKAKIESFQNQASQPAQTQRVKPEEVEEYGEKFYDFVKRAASEVVPQAASDVDKLKESVEAVAKEQQKVVRARFFEELGKFAPQWEALNTNQDFIEWLNGLDPYTGRPRQDLFDNAYGELDAWRVANFFNSFSGDQVPETPKPSLANQVVPQSNRSATAPPAKKIWTTPEVARFYDDCRRGVYKEDEAARIEKDLFAAQSEGRLR